ncbi:MAG: metallophosphoesterase [Planctomycetota bacterium]|nr:metallophosphoesterase [Planctomycetota bacterium]
MATWRVVRSAALLAASLSCAAFAEHPGHEPRDWCFIPDYTLPQQARNQVGPRVPAFTDPIPLISILSDPLSFRGMRATDRRMDLLAGDHLPEGPFTLELWICDHVNQPVGMLAAARSGDTVLWGLGYLQDGVTVFAGTGEGPHAGANVTTEIKELAYKQRWYHVVGVFDGDEVRLHVNGKRVAALAIDPSHTRANAETRLEISAYTEREPLMVLGNLVSWARLTPQALSAEQIAARFDVMRTSVDRGLLYPGTFHFNAGPHLNMATTTSIAMVWETDRPTTGVVEYGTAIPLNERVELAQPKEIHEVVISGLAPSTPYYYRVLATDSAGQTIDSGVLTFKTAVRADEPFRFAVIGDTEARPHINDRVCKSIWNTRPDFFINLGDLTDGGMEPHKFEWNHEYFLGMTQLVSRVPAFPVPGNGEGDLHWYHRYHALPEPQGYYSFVFGNAEFFMLDSNRDDAEFKPGGVQYEWLRAGLEASKATWKFAAHHHAVYSSDEDDYGNSWKGEPSTLGDMRLRPLTDLYARFGVDIVMYGHLHSYERSWPIRDGKATPSGPGQGVVYLQAGGAGGNLEDFLPTRTHFSRSTHRGHHHLVFNIHGDVLEMTTHDLDGDIIDVMRLTKQPQ